MPMVSLCSTTDISEALVIRSALEAYGVHATLLGVELSQQIPGTIGALNTITVTVSDSDLELAQQIVGQARKEA